MEDDCVIILDSDDEDEASNKKVEEKKPDKPPEKPRAVRPALVPAPGQPQLINNRSEATKKRHTPVFTSEHHQHMIGQSSKEHPIASKEQPKASKEQPEDTKENSKATKGPAQAEPKVNDIVHDHDAAAKAVDDMLEYCLAIAPIEKMKLVAKKITYRMHICQPKFKKSDYLLNLIKEQHQNMIENNTKMFNFLKIVSDELSYHKTRKRINPVSVPTPACNKVFVSDPKPGPSVDPEQGTSTDPEQGTSTDPEQGTSTDPEQGTSSASTSSKLNEHEEQLEKEKQQREQLKRQSRYKELEKAFERTKKIIRKLEETEVNWDDDNNSAYMMEFRYKKHLFKLHAKMKLLADEPLGSLKTPKQKITFNKSRHLSLNKKVEEFINRRKASKPPDFYIVNKFIQEAGKELELGLDPFELRRIAEDAFLALGKQLKNQRITELKTNLGCLLQPDATDPAENDPELDAQLKQNKENYKHREDEVMAEFTRKAEEQKLQPQEVGSNDEEDDSDSEKSEVEEEDEGEDEGEDEDLLSEIEVEVLETDDEQLNKPDSDEPEVYDLSDDEDEMEDLHLKLSSSDFDSDEESKQPPKSPEKDVVKEAEEKFVNPVSPPRISPISSQESEILIDSSQENASKPRSGFEKEVVTSNANSPPSQTEEETEILIDSSQENVSKSKPSSSFEEVFTRHISSPPQIDIPDETEIKTKTFAEAFTQHLLTSSVVIVKESAKPMKSIEEELNFLAELPPPSRFPVPILKRKLELCDATTKCVKSERLVVSPKLVLCDIPPMPSSQITIKKVQKARKTFPKSIVDMKPMQTPEITSSCNIDSDDDCIILD